MQSDDLGNLAKFLAVAQEASFTRAAAKLGVSQSALSHAIRRLEEKLGLRLLTRTTRSVAPTEAGERLLDTLRPAFVDIEAKLGSLTAMREQPAGTVRISCSGHAARTIPKVPHDLHAHACINLRLATAGVLYAWEFEKGGREIRVKVDGHLILNDMDIVVDAAIAGHGLAFCIEDHVLGHFADGSLVRVLEDWCEPFDGYYLYYPSSRQPTVAFRLLLDALRYRD